MLILAMLPLLFGAAFLLYRFLSSRPGARALWRSSLAIGLSIGVVRAVLACVGWYGVEHTGGPLQVPAFALAMLSWPEAIVLGSRSNAAPPSFYLLLALLLVVTSMLMIGGAALVVQLARGRDRIGSKEASR